MPGRGFAWRDQIIKRRVQDQTIRDNTLSTLDLENTRLLNRINANAGTISIINLSSSPSPSIDKRLLVLREGASETCSM